MRLLIILINREEKCWVWLLWPLIIPLRLVSFALQTLLVPVPLQLISIALDQNLRMWILQNLVFFFPVPFIFWFTFLQIWTEILPLRSLHAHYGITWSTRRGLRGLRIRWRQELRLAALGSSVRACFCHWLALAIGLRPSCLGLLVSWCSLLDLATLYCSTAFHFECLSGSNKLISKNYSKNSKK